MFLRERFPILKTKTYLSSHSLGAVPAATSQSLQKYFNEWTTLGIEAWDGPWSDMITQFSESIAQVIDAPKGTVTPMENVTRGMAAVASSLDWSGKRNKIVLTDLEFLTSYPFWQGFCEQSGARLVLVESDDGITVAPEKLIAAIDEETLLAPLSHVYFRSGAVQDLKKITSYAHQKGTLVLGDGYQAVGIVPFSVQDLNVDFYVGGSHKWLCGGPGAGFLYVREDWIKKLKPKFSGWFGIQDPFTYQATTRFEPASGITRFLAGTPSIPSLYAAIEGIKTVNEVGMKNIRTHSKKLTELIIARADELKLEVRTPRDPEQRSGMVCIDFKDAKAMAEKLIQKGIIVDYRPKCGIRISPHFYNTADDVEIFFETLEWLFQNELTLSGK
jgi:kynureninase